MSDSPHKSRIVADGRERILNSPAYRQKAQELRARVMLESAEEMARAPWWRKPLLKLALERKIRKELDALAPVGALYLRRDWTGRREK